MELFGENEGWFIVVKNFIVLPHYPRKIKYPQNIFKISLKKKNFFVIEEKIYVGLFHTKWLRTEITRIFMFLAI